MTPHLLLLSEIAGILGEATTLQDVLDRVVGLVAERMRTDVCSIWLLNGERTALTLAATEGLSTDAVGQATLDRGTGLTWHVVERVAPVAIEDAPTDPDYVYLPETKEEAFRSFLGLPLTVRSIPIGVLCIQTREPRRFEDDEVRALSAIASQIGPVVDNARLLSLIAGEVSSTPRPPTTPGPRRIQGAPCSGGVVYGPLLRVDAGRPRGPRTRAEPDQEMARLEHTLERARAELLEMQRWLRERNADEAALVFSVQIMMLEDRAFVGRMRDAVETGVSPASAIVRTTSEILDRFAGLKDIFFRERSHDVEDLAGRLLRHLYPDERAAVTDVRGKIAVIPDLAPSRLVSLCAEGVAAVLAGGGSATSHAALLAHSLDLPLVVGLGDMVKCVRSGEMALVNAASGEVVVEPPEDMVEEAERVERMEREVMARLDMPSPTPPQKLRIEANVSLWGDVERARRFGADGIGLYRTEFAFLMRPDLPGEDEQYVLYRRIVEAVHPLVVTFRLLDAGGDKLVPALGPAPEPNPFLGYRSLRLLLDHPELLGAQARAILHAIEGSSGRILVPMVGSVDDLRAVRLYLEMEGLDLPPVGAMIELPSALLQVRALAKEADFLSIGTNDLTQHILGVDRTNARVTKFFDAMHPACVRAFYSVVEAARAEGKPVSVCGEAASDPLLLPFWVGLGVDAVSVHANRILPLRALEARIDPEDAMAAVESVLRMDSASAIRERLLEIAPEQVRDLLAHRRSR